MAGDPDGEATDSDGPDEPDDITDDRLLSLLTGPGAPGLNPEANPLPGSAGSLPPPFPEEILLGSAPAADSVDEALAADIPSPYQQALREARLAAGLADRAGARHRSSLQALARLPYPWIRPAIRFLLWVLAVAITVIFAPSTQIPPLEGALGLFFGAGLALLGGEAAGISLKAALQKSGLPGRLLQAFNVGFLVAFLIAALFYFFFRQVLTGPVDLLLVALFVAAAASLPLLGTDVEQFRTLQRRAQVTAGRNAEAQKRVRVALKNLAAIHRENLSTL
ncbi:MAG TPA: hypothetical protein ENJ90_03015, partial [Devosia sp.]|nr:hypothetical protein [Devosia sp.]